MARIASHRTGPHAVYRIWGKDGALLYIGCSFRPFNRLKAHEQHQVWSRPDDPQQGSLF